MPNKELRIIIADASLARLVQIEKSLNKLGYHRILPIQVYEDLKTLSHAFDIVFDVLIANKELPLAVEDDLTVFCQNTRKFNHALLYGRQQATLTTTSSTSIKTLFTCTISVPGDELIENFMLSIDPPSPYKCINGLSWVKAALEFNKRVHATPTNDRFQLRSSPRNQ